MEKNRKQIKCPLCGEDEEIVVDIHADGYAHNLIECGVCGNVWSIGVVTDGP
jgi:uncharacterized Zn finger protein